MKSVLLPIAGVLATILGAVSSAAGDPRESAPAFPREAKWLNSEPLEFAKLKGRVVIVHFWTFGCVNCQRNYPVYKSWGQNYADKKVTIIGVHTPEFDSEKTVDKVNAKAGENDLKFPIVIDNDHRIWKAWRTRCWPTIFLVDKHGIVRYHWEGELHLEQAEAKRFARRIDELLADGE